MPFRFVALFAATTALVLGCALPASAGEPQRTDRTLSTRLKQHTLWATPASRIAADRATNRRVRAVAVRIADDQAGLDVALRAVADLLLPFHDGTPRHALGIVGLELVIAVSITAGVRRGAREGRWLRFHQAGYPAIGLLAVHAWLGAVSSGHLAVGWLAGITLLVPPVILSALRVLPASALVRAGLVEPAPEEPGPAPLRIDVDSHRCHSYGVCQAEAPGVFRLGDDGRLAYEERPGAGETPNVRAAARACPMRAIHLLGATS